MVATRETLLEIYKQMQRINQFSTNLKLHCEGNKSRMLCSVWQLNEKKKGHFFFALIRVNAINCMQYNQLIHAQSMSFRFQIGRLIDFRRYFTWYVGKNHHIILFIFNEYWLFRHQLKEAQFDKFACRIYVQIK